MPDTDVIWENPKQLLRLVEPVTPHTTVIKVNGRMDLVDLTQSPYLKIGNEIMEVVRVYADWSISVTRGAFNTEPMHHSEGRAVDWAKVDFKRVG